MRILVVEDEGKLAASVKRGLSAEHYAVDVAERGRTAVDLAREYHYDLLILDLRLPDMAGAEVLQRVRHLAESVPALVLTANGSTEEKLRLFALGADDYLTKPFVFVELIARVKALLRRGPVGRSNTLKVGDVELDQLPQRVSRAGRSIDLTAKEFSLLTYLMLNAERVLSRNMILEQVWDQSFDGISNIIEVYICQLREKLHDEGKPELIRTIRGSGYSIRVKR